MKKISLLFVSLFCFSSFSFSQSDDFTPGGKPFMKIFTNYHSSFTDGKAASAFEVNRVYLGYEYAFSNTLSAKANIDVGDPGVGKLEMTTYLKNAFLKYQNNNFTAEFGLISTTQFKAQEKVWGYRYIEKSFQDAYKFNASADLGLSLSYRFNELISTDFIITNGEGYKNLQSDSTFRSGFGLTLHPMENLTARLYYDFSTKVNTQSSMAAFISYTAKNFTVGAEYNKQFHVNFTDSRDMSGTSFYATLRAGKKLKVFARYDQLPKAERTGRA